MARGYKTVDELIPELEQMISCLRAEGVQVLPSERHLARETGSSVMTLRKALSVLGKRRMFVKNDRVRMIAGGADGLRQAVGTKIAMIAAGSGTPVNVTWLRLNFMLGEKMREIGAEFSTVCVTSDDDRESIVQRMGGYPEIIVFTDAHGARVANEILSLRDQCLIIGVDENMIGKCECLVALNNYQVGYMAAQKLIEAGCKRPAMNYADKGYMVFYHRRDGFISAMLNAGLAIDNCAYVTRATGEKYPGSELLPDTIEKICKAGHDGFFLFSDVLSQHVREAILKHYNIPDEFRLITLDSTGDFSSPFKISALSHGLEKSVEIIKDNVLAFARGDSFEKIRLVEPEYIPGDTI